MLERVEGNDDLYGTGNTGDEVALGGDSRLFCLLPPKLQPLLSDVETDDAPGPEQGHLLHFHTGAAAEIEEYFVLDFQFDSGQQNPQLAFAFVSFTTHCGRNLGSNQAQEVILKRGKHTGQPDDTEAEVGMSIKTG